MATRIRLFRLALPLTLAAALHAADSVAPGMNTLATTAYRDLARGSHNLIYSPFSISTALSMLLEGARGQTAEEISAVLHQIHPEGGYSAAVASLVDQLTRQSTGGVTQLLVANALWVQRGFPILPSFEETLRNSFKARLTPLDFSGGEQARTAINRWTEEQTKGRIRDLFGPGSLDRSTRLVLTSAIYFYGKWQSAFDARVTRPGPFRGEGGTSEARFMNQTSPFGYAETSNAQILEMKYAGTPIAFDVVLPKTDDGLAGIENSFTPAALGEWMAAVKRRTVEVAMPKFRVESDFSLKDMLVHMGMKSAFNGSADFSGIDDRRDLMVSAVKHKAFVDVAEEGTEAAAATGMVMTRIAITNPQHTVFRADHPFLFLIRDTGSGAILFAGRVRKP